ncbi:MAG TPA: hypothetical protein VFW65_06840 [Pseudonocardiaceae bacterium]|nr:hypothetical protein [Pseudonocardiaceae bacterium]
MTDRRLFALAVLTSALVAVQFALAGEGAFGGTYTAHMVVGLIIAAMTLIDLIAVLVSRAARSRPSMLWPAVALAVLAIAVEPLLAEAGKRIAAVGALHALTGVAILALTGWLVATTSRHREKVG